MLVSSCKAGFDTGFRYFIRSLNTVLSLTANIWHKALITSEVLRQFSKPVASVLSSLAAFFGLDMASLQKLERIAMFLSRLAII
jgi:hypothetical protein